VHRDVAEEFTRLFAAKIADLTVGDPMDEDTQVGPLATESGLEDVEKYVQDAVGKGATVLAGGKRVDRPGWFFEPTLLSGITPEMDLYAEEVFGPVAALFTVDSLDEAIEIANSHPYGLGSNLWSEDDDERAQFVRDIESGMAFINGMTTSYPELPFGGVKQSGYGRELTELGMREFMNAKTVWVGPPSSEQAEGGSGGGLRTAGVGGHPRLPARRPRRPGHRVVTAREAVGRRGLGDHRGRGVRRREPRRAPRPRAARRCRRRGRRPRGQLRHRR
jgi:succinate-semialdehyde dehydrogenase/glutarate-semialdehyde dehydrogenase